MHFLGGFSLGLLSLWIVHLSGLFGRRFPSLKQVLMTSFIFVLIAAVVWEVFEAYFGIANPSAGQSYWQDTISDLIFGLVGAIIAGFVASKSYFYHQEQIK
jgi:uncharacterized membrane protein